MNQRKSTKLKLSGRLLVVLGSIAISLTLVISWLVYLNISSISRIKATGNKEGGGNQLNINSEIISQFTWEKNPVTQAALGQDAISASNSAHSMDGGKASTPGLAPGTSGKDIDLVFGSTNVFDEDGIDISIDYRRNEKSGNFFTRGSTFNFGMSNGFIIISYRVEDKEGGYKTIRAITEYEIPQDNDFRNYRFIYDPVKGKAEIFVNSIIVWSHSGIPYSALYWKDAGNITIGKDMDGGGKDIPVFDNLVIRSAGSILPLAESLLNFLPEDIGGGNIWLHWSTSVNDRVSNFSVQRSDNGFDFATIATIKGNPAFGSQDEYEFSDAPPVSDRVIYYRIKQNFKDGKFVVHHLSAIKLSKVETALKIEKISPLPFGKGFDVLYLVPSSGSVKIQITDEKGKVKSSETFKAAKGKNIHVVKDLASLQSGSYTLNLIFGEKKVSAVVTKS